jgi:hypothetical protein
MGHIEFTELHRAMEEQIKCSVSPRQIATTSQDVNTLDAGGNVVNGDDTRGGGVCESTE